MPEKFWEKLPLNRLSPEQWEALCDGCARCCLEKLEDDDGALFYTRVACRFLDIGTCRCRHYEDRHTHALDCLPIRLDNEELFGWLPATCAYRLRKEGKSLPRWHYLVCGDREAVHSHGFSVRAEAVANTGDLELEEFIIDDV